jgi:predicted lipoprotein with Yx(FWY)xxD motif
VAGSAFGQMLFDGSGQAIYLFTAERGRRPACYGECAAAWPPVLAGGVPRAGAGVRPGLLGTTRRSDGRRQVTYGGHPLYYYAHEGRREVLCHDVEEYGGTWLVVRPDGTPAPAA